MLPKAVDGRKYLTMPKSTALAWVQRGLCGLRAFLIRPNGIVTWVAKENFMPNINAAKVALEQWFGL